MGLTCWLTFGFWCPVVSFFWLSGVIAGLWFRGLAVRSLAVGERPGGVALLVVVIGFVVSLPKTKNLFEVSMSSGIKITFFVFLVVACLVFLVHFVGH